MMMMVMMVMIMVMMMMILVMMMMMMNAYCYQRVFFVVKPELENLSRIMRQKYFQSIISCNSPIAPKTNLVSGLRACIWKGCNQLI